MGFDPREWVGDVVGVLLGGLQLVAGRAWDSDNPDLPLFLVARLLQQSSALHEFDHRHFGMVHPVQELLYAGYQRRLQVWEVVAQRHTFKGVADRLQVEMRVVAGIKLKTEQAAHLNGVQHDAEAVGCVLRPLAQQSVLALERRVRGVRRE